MTAGELEVAADPKEVAAAVERSDATLARGRKKVSASIGAEVMSLARRSGLPLGSRTQSPAERRTGSETPSTDSQH